MPLTPNATLPATQVLVLNGRVHSGSLGTMLAHDAAMHQEEDELALSGVDSGLYEGRYEADKIRYLQNGQPISLAEINDGRSEWLRKHRGIRELKAGIEVYGRYLNIGGALAHRLGTAGHPQSLRAKQGFTEHDIRNSELNVFKDIFQDDPELGPSLQTCLGMQALLCLSALPQPLSALMHPNQFRAVIGTTYNGMESLRALDRDHKGDAAGGGLRQAASLPSDAAARVTALLNPILASEYARKSMDAVDAALRPEEDEDYRLCQSPLAINAECASFNIALDLMAAHFFSARPSVPPLKMLLLMAADAPLADLRILRAFGYKVMPTADRLIQMGRAVHEANCYLSKDAELISMADGGGGGLVSTLDFSLRNFLPIELIFSGYAQSSQMPVVGHLGGHGGGGAAAIFKALRMSYRDHGLGVNDFGYFVAHGTGSIIGGLVDLNDITKAMTAARQRLTGESSNPCLQVGAPKTCTGHSAAGGGIEALNEMVRYVNGQNAVGVPTFRTKNEKIPDELWGEFMVSPALIKGSVNKGALASAQSYGLKTGALAAIPASREMLMRYPVEPKILDAYLERLPEINTAAETRRVQAHLQRKAALDLVLQHRWHVAAGWGKK